MQTSLYNLVIEKIFERLQEEIWFTQCSSKDNNIHFYLVDIYEKLHVPVTVKDVGDTKANISLLSRSKLSMEGRIGKSFREDNSYLPQKFPNN